MHNANKDCNLLRWVGASYLQLRRCIKIRVDVIIHIHIDDFERERAISPVVEIRLCLNCTIAPKSKKNLVAHISYPQG